MKSTLFCWSTFIPSLMLAFTMGLTAEEEVPDEKTFPDDEIVLPEP